MMKKANDLRAEIREILAKPQPWGPMVVPRIQAALKMADALMGILQDLDEKVKYYEEMRSDTKLSRNITIYQLNESGITQRDLAKQYGMSVQRVSKIIKTTKKHLEAADGTRIEGLPRGGNQIPSQQTG